MLQFSPLRASSFAINLAQRGLMADDQHRLPIVGPPGCIQQALRRVFGATLVTELALAPEREHRLLAAESRAAENPGFFRQPDVQPSRNCGRLLFSASRQRPLQVVLPLGCVFGLGITPDYEIHSSSSGTSTLLITVNRAVAPPLGVFSIPPRSGPNCRGCHAGTSARIRRR